MGRKKNTPGQNQSITKTAWKNFKAWDEQREDKTEVFKRCKSKKYWFVSNKERVISFSDKRIEPLFLQIETNKDGYKYVVTKEKGRTKTYYIHRLQAEVFEGVYWYGNARKYKTLDGLEVHHTEADKRNEPDCEEVLEPKTHDELFDKRRIPGITDDSSKHFEYEQRVMKVVAENTPDQVVVVFPGTGTVNGEETKDLTQAVYADDFPGVRDLANQAIEKCNNAHNMVMCVPKPGIDQDLYQNLIETPGEEAKLNEHIIQLYKSTNRTTFAINYKGINLMVKLFI